MKTTILVVCVLFATQLISSQESISASAKEISNANGSISYSFGQLVTTTYTGTGSVSHGVQHSIKIITLSNESLKELSLAVVAYPNPTVDNLKLSFGNLELTNLSYGLYNLNGVLVKNTTIKESETLISMHNLAAGVYILKITKKGADLKTFKIIKN